MMSSWLYQCVDFGPLAHVAAGAESAAAGRTDLLGGAPRTLLVDVGDHDTGARLGEDLRGRLAYTAGPAGHDRHLTIEPEVRGQFHCRTSAI
jgi:hypothetical protein